MTEQRIVPFLFEGEQMVRTVERDGTPWFVVVDVCAAIGTKNPSQAVAPLDGDERSMFNIGRQGDVHIVNESGLYTLILRSDAAIKPGTPAHRFRKWVTSEVLPALRQGTILSPLQSGDDDEPQTPDGLKLRKVNTAARCFGERAGAQLWVKLGLDWVPAMAGALSQGDLLDAPLPPAPGSVTITVSPMNGAIGGAH